MKKKGAKKAGVKSPLFKSKNVKGFKGLPKKAVRRYNKKGVKYYVDGNGKRITKEIYQEVKTFEKAKKSRPKQKKRHKLIELPAALHRAFLSLIKHHLFDKQYLIEITDANKSYFANGSFALFSSLRAMYNDLIKGMTQVDEESGEIYAEESNDLIYFPYIDITNKIISFNLGEVMLYNHPNQSQTPLQLNYLKQFFK